VLHRVPSLGGDIYLESVVIAYEIVHSIHKTKTPGVVIKLDYEKAYDRVNIDLFDGNSKF
jgi:hypothetical protein